MHLLSVHTPLRGMHTTKHTSIAYSTLHSLQTRHDNVKCKQIGHNSYDEYTQMKRQMLPTFFSFRYENGSS